MEVDGVGLLESESLGLIVAPDGAGETSVRKGGETVLPPLGKAAFRDLRGGGGACEHGGGETELDVMEPGLVAEAVGDGVVDLATSSVEDGSAAFEIVVEEIFEGVLGIDCRGEDGVDATEDGVEGEGCATGLDVSETLREGEGIGVVSVLSSVVRREEGVDLCEVGEGARLFEGPGNATADAETVLGVCWELVSVALVSKVDRDTGGVRLWQIIEFVVEVV